MNESGKEVDSFYLAGYFPSTVTCFKHSGTKFVGGKYVKLDLPSLADSEVIENFSLGGVSGHEVITFWTKTSDGKYHIYTQGNPSSKQIGREYSKADGFKKIKNTSNKNYDFNSIKEIALTDYALAIWTKETNGKDHIYFGGYNSGQFGDGSINDANNTLKETTNYISKSIKNKKIKDISFEYGDSGFILTDDNKLFTAGRNNYGELGVPVQKEEGGNKYVISYSAVNTSVLNGAKIKQMSTAKKFDNINGQTLLLITNNNKLWALGSDFSYHGAKTGGYSLGIPPNSGAGYVTKLTQIPLQGIVPKGEELLYATTSQDNAYTTGWSGYSILVTKTSKGKHKIYMAGNGEFIKNPNKDKKYRWAYNEELTQKIFGMDQNSGLDINLNIPNLGNSTVSTPITLTSWNIAATGIIKKDKNQQYQEKYFAFGGQVNFPTTPAFPLFATTPTKVPFIYNSSSVKITDSFDKKNNKASIIYTFNIETYGMKLDLKKSSLIEPETKVSHETYDLQKGDENGKGWKITIGNIDLSQLTIGKNTIYNDNVEKHKFNLKISYKDNSGNIYALQFVSPFDPFTIITHNSPKITLSEYEPDGEKYIVDSKTSFTYSFKIDQNLNGHSWTSSGQGNTGLTPKIKKDSPLDKIHAKLNLKKIVEGNDTFYKLIVSNLPPTKATYNIRNDIYLEGPYNVKGYKEIGSGIWRSNENGWNFGEVDFVPVFVVSPLLTVKQIILIGAGVLLFAILLSGSTIGFLRKKDAKAFSKYEAKQMSLDSNNYALSTVEKERTKKETRQAIKEWKKRMKQDKKFK